MSRGGRFPDCRFAYEICIVKAVSSADNRIWYQGDFVSGLAEPETISRVITHILQKQ